VKQLLDFLILQKVCSDRTIMIIILQVKQLLDFLILQEVSSEIYFNFALAKSVRVDFGSSMGEVHDEVRCIYCKWILQMVNDWSIIIPTTITD
jgi:hypothetical protein